MKRSCAIFARFARGPRRVATVCACARTRVSATYFALCLPRESCARWIPRVPFVPKHFSFWSRNKSFTNFSCLSDELGKFIIIWQISKVQQVQTSFHTISRYHFCIKVVIKNCTDFFALRQQRNVLFFAKLILRLCLQESEKQDVWHTRRGSTGNWIKRFYSFAVWPSRSPLCGIPHSENMNFR